MLNWAAETARNIALSASQVLQKLEHRGLSLEDTAAPRGKPAGRQKQMAGGGINPYESAPMPHSRYAPNGSTVIKGAGAVQVVRGSSGTARVAGATTARTTGNTRTTANTRTAGTTSSKASAPARSSWWQRLFRRG